MSWARYGRAENNQGWNQDITIQLEQNVEKIQTHLPTSSKWTLSVAYINWGTYRQGHVWDTWGNSSIRYPAWQCLIHCNRLQRKEGYSRWWQEIMDAQAMNGIECCLWVYGTELGRGFSLRFMSFVIILHSYSSKSVENITLDETVEIWGVQRAMEKS